MFSCFPLMLVVAALLPVAPITITNPPKCDSKREPQSFMELVTRLLGGQTDTHTRDYQLVIEYQEKYDLGSASDRKARFTLEDEIVFFYQWISDQLVMFRDTGRFHTDGHPGNLLVKKDNDGHFSFVWNDFGKTTSFFGHPEKQFQATIIQMSKFFHHRPVVSIAKELTAKHCRRGRFWCSPPADDDLEKHFEYLLGRLEELKDFDGEVWPRLSGRRMGARVAKLEKEVAGLKKEVADLKKENAGLKKENAGLKKKVADLEKQVAALQSAILQLQQKSH